MIKYLYDRIPVEEKEKFESKLQDVAYTMFPNAEALPSVEYAKILLAPILNKKLRGIERGKEVNELSFDISKVLNENKEFNNKLNELVQMILSYKMKNNL